MASPIIRECRHCGRSFEPDPSNVKRGWGWYCSHECASAPRQTFEERFWSQVNKTETCWLWTGTIASTGYGIISIKNRRAGVHRVLWEHVSGKPVPVGMFVCHHCDIRACVRPDHLFLGTHQDNMADMRQKGRHHGNGLAGEQHSQAKLLADDVAAIRERWAHGGISQRELGEIYGVHQVNISRIVRGVASKND